MPDLRSDVFFLKSRFWLASLCFAAFYGTVAPANASPQSTVMLVEAESFANRGGWKLDTQFIHEMGSPYLLAHGLGRPVADATTTFEVTEAGR